MHIVLFVMIAFIVCWDLVIDYAWSFTTRSLSWCCYFCIWLITYVYLVVKVLCIALNIQAHLWYNGRVGIIQYPMFLSSFIVLKIVLYICWHLFYVNNICIYWERNKNYIYVLVIVENLGIWIRRFKDLKKALTWFAMWYRLVYCS